MEERTSGGVGADSLAEAVKERARELGFGWVGIASPGPSDHTTFYRRWLDEGRHGEMGYLAREDAVERRADLRGTLTEVCLVVVVAHPYFVEDREEVPDDASVGVIARYARGRDYHKVVKKKLLRLLETVRERADGHVEGRAYVETESGSWASGRDWAGSGRIRC